MMKLSDNDKVYEENGRDYQFNDDINMENIKYSFSKGLGKGVASFLIFAVPVIIDHFIVSMPTLANLSIGGALIVGWNWVKFHYIRA